MGSRNSKVNNTSKEVEAIQKDKRKVLGMKNTITDMNKETGRLTPD